jgi:carboxypeptidase Taq
LLGLVREAAECLAATLKLTPYDALLDGWQPGIGGEEIATIFARFEPFLRTALPEAEALQAARPAARRPAGPFPADLQEVCCREIAAAAGLDFRHARLDRSAHPFCRGTPADVRITTRYNEADLSRSPMSVLHETGHALYERQLPAAFLRQPVGEAAGAGVHESQALLFEMQAGRSDAYLMWLGRLLQRRFGGDPTVYELGNLGRLWRRVSRSLIRIEADELTYPAHVMLRFRLETALIAGDLAAADLPAAWNDEVRRLLGITPPDDAQGCLQDIHWYDGGYGYFPNYTLGAMAAAQLMAAARRALPDLDGALRRGDLSSLGQWMNTHIHAKGQRLGFNDLLREATGKPLDASEFEAHLTARYLS